MSEKYAEWELKNVKKEGNSTNNGVGWKMEEGRMKSIMLTEGY